MEHNGEAIRGFAAARRPTHLSQALSNRSSARLALAQLHDEHTVENHDLLDAAEIDASEAISVLGDDVHGVDAGRRWWQLGRVLAARDGYSPSMIAAFERALADLTPETAPSDCRDAGRHIADLASAADDWERGASAWRQAADAGAALVQTRATLAGRLSEVSANGNLARWAAYALVQVGSLAEAIEVLERGRALQLATWLGRDIVDLEPLRGASPELCARFVDLRRHVELGERDSAAVHDAVFARAVEELSTVIKEIRTLPGLDGFLLPPSAPALLGRLAPEEAIAYPLVSPWGSVWLVAARDDREQLKVEAIELSALTAQGALGAMVRVDAAGGRAEGFLIEQSRESDGLRLAQELGHVAAVLGPSLMAPLASALEGWGRRSVCVIPVGPLAFAPLHALTWPTESGERCLIDFVDVTFAASAYVRQVCRGRAAGRAAFARLLVVGNPLPSSVPLPDSEIEARAIAATVPADECQPLLREAATKEAVLAALPSASHIHLACHGEAAGDPLGFEAALRFSGDTAVSAEEILDVDLSQARLVVASACETAIAAGYDTVDEVLSLSSVLLAAGAAGAIASYWKVDDYATRLLMTRFYEELTTTPDHPAQALRAAQLWLRELTWEEETHYRTSHPVLGGERRPASCARAIAGPEDRRLSSPLYWGAFALSGA